MPLYTCHRALSIRVSYLYPTSKIRLYLVAICFSVKANCEMGTITVSFLLMRLSATPSFTMLVGVPSASFSFLTVSTLLYDAPMGLKYWRYAASFSFSAAFVFW